LLEEFEINANDAWMIGDTNHDFEVARELGINCILVADGHQSFERLKETGAEVASSLDELQERFSGI
jgi:phosphoglycolate phosphatase